ncbi:hypothetical protein LJC51_06310 [Lachnospiraceae bacterium OttesenSCG-928-J05]|nr:hypothetical protein [Lachnospiraceae bacterium OttesenSCG-928-J05]
MRKDIIGHYQMKSRHLNEVWRLTGELGEAIGNNDTVVIQMVLDMRGEELATIATIDEEIREGLANLPREKKEELEKQIEECNDYMLQVWRKTVALDQHLNTKIAGKDSFYFDKTQMGPPL